MNFWEGQGTVIDTGGGRSNPGDKPGSQVDWGSIIGAAPGLLCAISPSLCPSRPMGDNVPPTEYYQMLEQERQRRQRNTIWWAIGIISLVLLIILIIVMTRK